mgnify:CR=1 FL=1
MLRVIVDAAINIRVADRITNIMADKTAQKSKAFLTLLSGFDL